MGEPGCLFCRIVAGEIPSQKLYEDDQILAFADIRPQAPVHALIIPKQHIPTVADVTREQEGLVGRLVGVANQLAATKGLEDGYRLVFNCREAAGQEVFHLHLHLLGGRNMNWPPG